jgi:fumarate reductase flavoprotein subunit
MRGLFAAGEAACWDMHGFNRLGGNSVAETVVAGMIVGDFVADFCDSPHSEVRIPTGLVREFIAAEQAKLDVLVHGPGTEDASALRIAMQEIMTAKVGIFRTGADLQAAVTELQALLERSRHIGLRHREAGANPELVTAYRTQKMLKLALCVAYGAAQRTESRGAHFREDFPRRDDASWLKRTLATWGGERDLLPTLQYEALDVHAMELPPGWRGYGNKDYVDHPDTAARAAQVAALREGMNGASRHDVQQALMPYQELLPQALRGLNERIDEPL